MKDKAAYQREWARNNPDSRHASTNKWRAENKEKAQAINRGTHRRRRLKALALLGDRCLCCGERHQSMLDIDHRFGGGSKERREQSGNNNATYREIRTMPDPKSKYQVLCSNCNQSRRRNGGTCEHLTELHSLTRCHA